MTAPILVLLLSATRTALPSEALPAEPPAWEAVNPVRPLPAPPLGSPASFGSVPWVTPEKVRLGRWLFFDRRLSADGTVSCASCHQPDRAFSDGMPGSRGIQGQVGSRKAPPILNAAWPARPAYFWDGRAASLQEQALGPIFNPAEMGSSPEKLLATLRAIPGYGPYFREAFGDPAVELTRVAEALAAYEATRLAGNSPADRYEAGDLAALSPEARKGRDLFHGKANCKACHEGPNLTDGKFHNLGVGYRGAAPDRSDPAAFADVGRHAVTRAAADVGAFKTPTLRNLRARAPYMHDGSLATLREVVEYYQKGGADNPLLDADMIEVDFKACDTDFLVAYLEAMDGTGFEDRAPAAFPQ